MIPKSGHTINLDEPDFFNRCVLDFVTAVDGRRWTPRNPASLSRSAILLQTEAQSRDELRLFESILMAIGNRMEIPAPTGR